MKLSWFCSGLEGKECFAYVCLCHVPSVPSVPSSIPRPVLSSCKLCSTSTADGRSSGFAAQHDEIKPGSKLVGGAKHGPRTSLQGGSTL